MGLIVANTFPKSGTGLLRQILDPVATNLGHLGYYNNQGTPMPRPDLLYALEEYKRQGEKENVFITAHLPHSYLIREELKDTKFIMLYRDPRAVCVSHAHYVQTTPAHYLCQYYKDLPDMEARIRTSITGLDVKFPDVGQRFLPYMPWLYEDFGRWITFEDLLTNGPYGIQFLADYIGVPGSYDKMTAGAKKTDNQTFRLGSTTAWRKEMSVANQDLFEQVAGWLRRTLNYGY